MFLEVFEFICSCIVQILNILKKLTLFPGFTLYNFVIATLFVSCLLLLLDFIKGRDSKWVFLFPFLRKLY